MTDFIYLIREREFIRLNEPVYKIGKTEQSGLKRSKQYPKGSCIEIHLRVNNCHTAETELLKYFRRTFKPRTDFGAEYFEGDANAMLVEIFRYRYIAPAIQPPIQPQVVAPSRTVTISKIGECVDTPFDIITKQFRDMEISRSSEEKVDPASMENCHLLKEADELCASIGAVIRGGSSEPALIKLYLKYGFDTMFKHGIDPSARIDLAGFIEDLWIHYKRQLGLKIISCAQYHKYVDINNTIFELMQRIKMYSAARRSSVYARNFPEIHIGEKRIHWIDSDVYDFQQGACCDFKKHFRDFPYSWDL